VRQKQLRKALLLVLLLVSNYKLVYMGIGKGEFRNLTFSYKCFGKKGCFLSFEWSRRNHFWPLAKCFWLPLENPLLALPWIKSFRRPCAYIQVTNATFGIGGCYCHHFPPPWLHAWCRSNLQQRVGIEEENLN